MKKLILGKKELAIAIVVSTVGLSAKFHDYVTSVSHARKWNEYTREKEERQRDLKRRFSQDRAI